MRRRALPMMGVAMSVALSLVLAIVPSRAATVGQVIGTIPVGNEPVDVVFSTDGTKAYAANKSSNSVSVIDTATMTVLTSFATFFDGEPQSLALSPDGTSLFVAQPGASRNEVSVFRTSSNSKITDIGVANTPFGVAVAPNGDMYVTRFNGQTVSRVNNNSGFVSANLTVGNGPSGVAVSPDGGNVYVANSLSNTVSIINATTFSVTVNLPVGVQPTDVAISPDGAVLYATNRLSNSVSVIDTLTNQVIDVITVGSSPVGVSFNPTGAAAYVANSGGDSVTIISTDNHQVVGSISVGDNPTGIAVSPTGDRLLVTNATSNTVSVVELTDPPTPPTPDPSPDPTPDPTPAPTPTPTPTPFMAQSPVKALGLPKAIKPGKKTRLVRLPVEMTSGVTANVEARCLTAKRASCRVTTSSSALSVKTTGKKRERVQVSITAAAVGAFEAYEFVKTYRIRALSRPKGLN